MKKRFLAALLALCMVFALGTVSALATDGESTNKLPEADDGVITLKGDVEIEITELSTELKSKLSDNKLEINLDGHTLTITNPNKGKFGVQIEQDADITIRNGKIVAEQQKDGAHSLFAPKSDASFTLDYVTLTTNGTGIYAAGSATAVNVNNSTINAGGYAIGTNATADESGKPIYSFNVDINVSKSTLNAPIGALINVPGSLDISNSEINAQYQGVIARGGSTTINNTKISLSGVTDAGEYEKYENEGWGSGNAVPMGGIVVGNRSNDYNYPSSCTVSGSTSVTVPEGTNAVYAYQMSDTTNRKVDLTIKKGTFNADVVIAGDGVTPAVSISGGKFTNAGDLADYLDNGYTFGENGNVEISDDAVAQVGDTVYTDLQEAINAAQSGTTKTVTLLKDVPLTDGLTISKNITIDGRNYDLTISGVTGDGIKITSGHTLTLANTNLKITGKTNTADNFDGTGINAVGSLTLKNSDVVLEDLNKAIIANANHNEIKLEDSTLTIDDIDGNASNGGKWTVDDSTVNISDVGNYGLSVYSLKTTGASELSFENIGYGAIFAELSIDIGGTTSVKIDNAGFNHEKNTIIRESTYGDCYAPIQLVVDKKGLPTSGREITFGSGTSISVVDSFDYNGDVYVDEGTEYANNSGDYLSVKIVDGDVFMVTFVDDDDDFLFSYTVDKNDDITLPGRPYYSAREFIGWLCDEDHKIYEASDKYEDVDKDLEFKAVWEAAAYDIVIDDDILHGDIWTSPKSEAEAGDTVHVYADPDAGYVLEDLSVTYRSGRNELKLTRVSANHYTFTMPAYNVYVTAEFTSDGFPFDDVRSNQWFYDAVYYVWANDLMEGVDYDEFNPNGTMTRAMFWAVLGRIDGETITGTNWADEARDWAMSEGVSDGTNPSGLVTREQMVTMLWRYAGERDGSGNLSRYTDGDKVAQYATEAMRWALGNGIIEGTTATTLEPQATATRAQCAAIFMRYYE